MLWLKLLPAYLLIMILISLTFFSNLIFKPSSAFQNNDKQRMESKHEEMNQCIAGMPIALSIPRIKVNVAIKVGDYMKANNTWQITNSSAFFASLSARPNNLSGDTLIYGHNTSKIFGKTKDLQNEDRLYLYTDNDLVFEYRFTDSQEVKPDDVKSLDYQGSARLTLVTCSGLFNEKRRLMRFKLASVGKLQQSVIR